MNDLLDQKLEVSSVCEQLIRKSKRQYATIAVLFTIISLIGIAVLVYRAYIYSQREFEQDLNTRIYPYLMIFYILLSLFQLYYYFKAITKQKTAVDNIDQDKFEASFQYYVSGNKLNIISLALYLLIQLFPFVIAFFNK